MKNKQPRKTIIEETRPVGTGSDGNEYGVLSLRSTGGFSYRRKPCDTCPYRKDAEVGRFPPDAYTEAANVAYDQSFKTFACHESGAVKSAICAGFLLTNSRNNIMVRLKMAQGALDLSKVGNPDNVPMYDSYRDMAVANGVDPNHPKLQACRADNEGRQDDGNGRRVR